MNKVWIGVLIAAIVGVALWKFDVFGAKSETPLAPPPGPRASTDAPGGDTLQGTGGKPAREEPKEEPAAEWFPLESPVRVLFVLERVMQWPQYMGLALKEDPQIEFTYYSTHPAPNEQALVSADQQAVVERPTGDWFEKQAFDVLIVGACDPGELGEDFWQAVSARLRTGRLGLWVWPDMPPAPPEKPQTSPVHPMLSHPLFRTLLPVAEADRLEGKPVPGRPGAPIPGVFSAEARFGVTTAGTTHPASRFVPFPQWSRNLWLAGAAASPPWGSKFIYPVTKLRPGAVTLVDALPAKGEPIPMFVQGPTDGGRVLWFGAHDFGDATYRNLGPSLAKWNALVHNSVVWLAGRAPRE